MIRKEAMDLILKKIKSEPIISANGFISRDLFELKEKNSNFYMIGSMGLSSSIGLGVALKNPKKRVYVFDGDGNILMNLGSLTTIGTLKPKNLGRLRVALSLNNDGAKVSIVTETSSAALLLSEAESKLSQMLEGSGLKLTNLNTSSEQGKKGKR